MTKFLLRLLIIALFLPATILTIPFLIPGVAISFAFTGDIDASFDWAPLLLLFDWAAYINGQRVITPLFKWIKSRNHS